MYFEALASGGDDWYNIVLITAPEGAPITFDDGDEEITVTGTGMQYPVPLHNDSSIYSITVDANGFVQTDSVTTSAVSGTVFTKKISYAKIRLTFDDAFRGQNFNITDGSISPSTQQAFPSTGNTIDLYVPNTGTWKTSSSAAGESYESKGATVTDIDGSYLDELHTRPDGKTATPTDVIQTWLECAGIRNKSYTTLEEVLADKETLQTLMSDENAVDYMVRSKSWITSKGLVPIMTSMTTPKGEVIESGHYSTQIGYLAFDGNDATGWSNTNGVPQGWLGYTFTSPKIVKFVSFKATRIATFTIQGSNDGFVSDTHELTSVISTGAMGDTAFTYDVDLSSNTTAYESYRINILTTTQYEPKIHTLQFYSRTDDGITDDPTAMRYIGLRNYAADTLLDDADWCEAICDSEYWESVLNVSVPTMTSNNAPTPYIISSDSPWTGSGNRAPYLAFDNDPTTFMNFNVIPTASSPHYVRVDFGRSVQINKMYLLNYSTTYGVATGAVQGSNDGVTFETIKEISHASGTDAETYIIENSNSYRYYQLLVYTMLGDDRAVAKTLQFYGREDVDESVIHIYSAASDNDIHYLSGSTPVTVASTDPDGHGTIARTLLPAGTYDLYSSVAMDPDGDLSTEYFHKEITVKADTIEIMLMPENALYWWGYKKNINGDIKSVIPSTSYTGVTDINANTQYINTSGAAGVITPLPIGKNTMIAKAVAKLQNASNVGEYLDIYDGTASNVPKVSSNDNLATLHLMRNHITNGTISNGAYVAYNTTSGSHGTSYGHLRALWYERPNPLANFFSAARDAVYYMSGGVQVVVAETNDLGEAVVDLSSIPTSVELYSSVAFDPDGDMSTQYYHKTFALDADGKFHLMPDNVLYWYGYIGDDFEECSTANGWMDGTYASPTYNTDFVNVQAASGYCGIANRSLLTNKTAHFILKSYGSAWYGWGTAKKLTTNLGNQTTANGFTTTDANTNIHHATVNMTNASTPSYINLGMTGVPATRQADVYAMWYE